MTEDELNKIVEAKLADQLAARLQADRERVRMEVIMEIRRKAEREWYDQNQPRHRSKTSTAAWGRRGTQRA